VVPKVRDSRYPAGAAMTGSKNLRAARDTPIAGFALKANKFDGIHLGRLKGNGLVYAL
jgi:bifunctional non-homologous end joining protein LigD